MSTTIETVEESRHWAGAWWRGLAILSTLLIGWFGAMVVLMLVFDISSKALVVGPGLTIAEQIPEDVSLLDADPYSLIVTSDEPGYVRRLYASGAWIVFPSLNPGCLDLNALAFRNGKP